VSGGLVAAVLSGGDVGQRWRSMKRRPSCNSESRDAKIWIVDTGATNHMTGFYTTFIDLDPRVRRTVQFGDDSSAENEGHARLSASARMGSTLCLRECISSPSSRPTLLVLVT
jgi:hypothetical protein